jgi:hypothetical protein
VTFEQSRKVYYQVFTYTNGFEAAYGYGARLNQYLRGGGGRNDENARAIMNAARQYAATVLQSTPWANEYAGAFWQGFADGFDAGRAEGGTAVRRPTAGDFNRVTPPQCRNRDRSRPNYDDLVCAEINYGPGMLGR